MEAFHILAPITIQYCTDINNVSCVVGLSILLAVNELQEAVKRGPVAEDRESAISIHC